MKRWTWLRWNLVINNMNVETVIEDWLKIISGSADSARIASGMGVRRLKNGKPSVVTLEPTGEERGDKPVFKATLKHKGGVVDGGELVSDIPLDNEQIQDIKKKNKAAVKKYESLMS